MSDALTGIPDTLGKDGRIVHCGHQFDMLNRVRRGDSLNNDLVSQSSAIAMSAPIALRLWGQFSMESAI